MEHRVSFSLILVLYSKRGCNSEGINKSCIIGRRTPLLPATTVPARPLHLLRTIDRSLSTSPLPFPPPPPHTLLYRRYGADKLGPPRSESFLFSPRLENVSRFSPRSD